MQIKKFLIMLLVFSFMFGEVAQAQTIPTSTTLKEGIYDISHEHQGYYRNIKLTTPDKPVTITLLNSKGAQILFAVLSNENDYIKFGPIEIGETLIVTGEGEISVIH
ncbi:hypothetical protein [Clostridium sp. YIM B02555]|uniref:hypothetical protein n=1 Tax=Clostridium sp. YIM B02555 TaxID=2911968 RepID=UPI001EEEE89E|nr:hypothetical protein [Clostridium sp. YIM B02555]